MSLMYFGGKTDQLSDVLLVDCNASSDWPKYLPQPRQGDQDGNLSLWIECPSSPDFGACEPRQPSVQRTQTGK